MSFLETPRFPDNVSYGSKGGPVYNTSIVVVDSGFETRNINWSVPLALFDVAYGVRTAADLYSLIEFFHAVAGRGHSFRYKDWSDYKSCVDQLTGVVSSTDQLIGVGDGAEVSFPLIKTYKKGDFSRVRYITKPVAGTIVASIDDVDQGAEGGTWNVDTTTGVVVFDTAPGNLLDVKAGYQFDVPCRFDSDELETQLDHYDVRSASVNLTEIRI